MKMQDRCSLGTWWSNFHFSVYNPKYKIPRSSTIFRTDLCNVRCSNLSKIKPYLLLIKRPQSLATCLCPSHCPDFA